MAIGSLTNAGEIMALNKVSGADIADQRFVRLYTTAPAADGTGGVEPNGSHGYVQQAVSFSLATTGGDGRATTANTTELVFGRCKTAAWGSIVAIGIANAMGSLLWYAELANPKIVEVDDRLHFAIGDIDLYMD